MGCSPILGSLGGCLLEDSLESRFLLLELILLFGVVELQLSQRTSQFSQLQYLEVGFFVLRFLVS